MVNNLSELTQYIYGIAMKNSDIALYSHLEGVLANFHGEKLH